MIKHKYGEFADLQFDEAKESIRKRIFFLLLLGEDIYKQTNKYPDIDVYQAYKSLMWELSGLNELLGEPKEIITVLSLLEEAKINLETDFNWEKYRKLILDAGAKIEKVACPYINQSAKNALQN